MHSARPLHLLNPPAHSPAPAGKVWHLSVSSAVVGNWALMPEVDADGRVDRDGRHVVLKPQEAGADVDMDAPRGDERMGHKGGKGGKGSKGHKQVLR